MKRKTRYRDLKQQVYIEKKRRSRVLLVIVSAVFLYLSVSLIFGEMGLIKYMELRKTEKRLRAELIAMEKEKKTIRSQIDSLKKDPFYIEKHAREDFGLAKPNEYIFQFQNDVK